MVSVLGILSVIKIHADPESSSRTLESLIFGEKHTLTKQLFVRVFVRLFAEHIKP